MMGQGVLYSPIFRVRVFITYHVGLDSLNLSIADS